MRKKYMKVVVSGLPRSGKTLLAELIGDTLADHGFDILMETDEEEEMPEERQAAAIKALADSGIQIIVQERDAQSRPSHPPKPKKKPPKNYFTGKDETIRCSGCKADFIFTAGEQEFFKEKGLDKAPRRCRGCRQKKRSKRNDAGVAQW